MPFEDSSFDGAYAIEATCHAPKVSHRPRSCRVAKELKPDMQTFAGSKAFGVTYADLCVENSWARAVGLPSVRARARGEAQHAQGSCAWAGGARWVVGTARRPHTIGARYLQQLKVIPTRLHKGTL